MRIKITDEAGEPVGVETELQTFAEQNNIERVEYDHLLDRLRRVSSAYVGGGAALLFLLQRIRDGGDR
jgi:hypothetical protein